MLKLHLFLGKSTKTAANRVALRMKAKEMGGEARELVLCPRKKKEKSARMIKIFLHRTA